MKVIGVDVGGTFTDIMLVDSETGTKRIYKLPSSTDSQDRAVIEGIERLLSEGNIDPTSVHLVVHGTTVATNAMLERRGAKVCLLTTKGIEDALEIGRQNREEIYSLHPTRPTPLVSRENRIGVKERLDNRGEVINPLTSEEIERVVALAKSKSPDSVAISLLFSYENPRHERNLMAKLEENSLGYVVSSSNVLPEFREYERTSTTVLEAYLGPLVVEYVENLDESLSHLLPNARFAVMQSNGGSTLANRVRGKSVGLAISGLAGGVIGGWEIARREGVSHAITLDMGGTSCDISAVIGQVDVRPDNEIGGIPLRVPSVDVNTIGAGGGSIAWIDDANVMHVGPQSAGAKPGPAAYGRGGTDATVTDATLLVGRLNPDYFLGGRMKLDRSLAHKAVAAIADQVGLSVHETAHGIIRISTINMVQAIRETTVLRGHDPREFVLVAFGGAGPTQAVDIADELGIRSILIPPKPGITSALGLLVADLRTDLMRSVKITATSSNEKEILTTLNSLTEEGISQLEEQGAKREAISIEWSIDMRYEGQSHELQVKIPYATKQPSSISHQEFSNLHKREFGYNIEDRDIEWVTARVVAVASQGHDFSKEYHKASNSSDPNSRPILLSSGEEIEAPVYRRKSLTASKEYFGPFIVEQEDTTTYVAPGWRASQNARGSLWVRRERS